MKGYTVMAEEIREYVLISPGSDEAVYRTETEEKAVDALARFAQAGQRLELRKVIRMIVDVDE